MCVYGRGFGIDTGTSGYVYPAEADHLSSAADTLVEVVHSKRHPAVVAEAEATAWPNDDGTRRALADHALRPLGPEPGGAGGPGSLVVGAVRRSRLRYGPASGEEDLFETSRFLVRAHRLRTEPEATVATRQQELCSLVLLVLPEARPCHDAVAAEVSSKRPCFLAILRAVGME